MNKNTFSLSTIRNLFTSSLSRGKKSRQQPQNPNLSTLSHQRSPTHALVYVQMFHQSAIALTIGGMSF
jgi:hypothetical protein